MSDQTRQQLRGVKTEKHPYVLMTRTLF